MLKNGIRTCDVCEDVIEKGEKYVTKIIEKENVELVLSVVQTGTIDDSGTLRIDVCITCHLSMDSEGKATIN